MGMGEVSDTSTKAGEVPAPTPDGNVDSELACPANSEL